MKNKSNLISRAMLTGALLVAPIFSEGCATKTPLYNVETRILYHERKDYHGTEVLYDHTKAEDPEEREKGKLIHKERIFINK